MLSLCTFIVLILIGYFFIDQKTKNELINKCKKNKIFVLIAGALFVYFFFYNVEGMGIGTGTGTGTEDSDYTSFADAPGGVWPNIPYTAFIRSACHDTDGQHNMNRIRDLTNVNIPEDKTSCLLKGLQNDVKREISPYLVMEGPMSGGHLTPCNAPGVPDGLCP